MSMQYVAVTESDIGISKNVNQDSVLIKHATYAGSEILMAIIADGMGGLAKGEVASAAVIHRFNNWFANELPQELKRIDMRVIGGKWSLMLKELNIEIQEYGNRLKEKLGTTFTGLLIINNQFVTVHIGDTRLYYIGEAIEQLTNDHTFVAREVREGNLTPEEAKIDRRRNMLLQCVGASKCIEPDVFYGEVKQGVYMLCSDGFRHKISKEEIYSLFNFKSIKTKQLMFEKIHKSIEIVKQRGEKDNISVILIRSLPIMNKREKDSKKLINKFKYKKVCIAAIALLIIGIALLIFGMLFI